MEYLPLEITLISAENLKDVNLISKMDVYVVVSVADDPNTKQKTRVDKDGGKNPKWNDRLKFSIDAPTLARNPNLPLVFRLRSERPLRDKDIGEVAVPMKELLDNNTAAADGASDRVVDYQVRTPSGKPKGTLKFSFKVGEKVTGPPPSAAPLKMKNSDGPVTAYPAYQAQAGASTAYPPPPPPGVGYAQPNPAYAGYPPPQQGYGYPQPPPPQYAGYPPAPAYGYPPQQGYGYPPQVVQPQQAKKKNNNLGLGLGLGAGLLGGLLVGDMISDVGEMGGYDGGFDDAGFDF